MLFQRWPIVALQSVQNNSSLPELLSMWTVASRINGMEQNMLREDQALPIRGLALHKQLKASNIHKTVYKRGDRFH